MRATLWSTAILLLVTAAGCGGPGPRDAPEAASVCDRPAADATVAPDAVGLTADQDFTKAMAIVDAAGGGTEIEWQPVYAVVNLTDEPICVRDVTIDFPARVMGDTGISMQLARTGPSRLVDVFPDDAALKADTPADTRPPPLEVPARATVTARFHQYFAIELDGDVLPLAPDATLAEYLGPYLGLERLGEGGLYHCATVFTGMEVVVTTNAGRSTHEVAHLIMPAGCARVIPPR